MRFRVPPALRVPALVLGWILVAAGAVITPLPPPFAFGVPLLVAGLLLVLPNSRGARRRFVRLVHEHPRLLGPLRALLRRRRAT